MLLLRSLLLLLLSSSTTVAAHRSLQSSDEEEISFDGSVEEIVQLAFLKAQKASASTDSPFACPELVSTHLNVVTFDYSIEHTGDMDEAALVEELEWALQVALAPRVLSCVDEDNAAGIVSISRQTQDQPFSEDGTFGE